MESVIYLDTHVVVWLYAGEMDLFSRRAIRSLEKNDPIISPIVELELQYLLETERITVPPDEIIQTLAVEMGLRKCTHHFASIVTKSLKMTWTRDPFDRIITAHAAIDQSLLLTKDQTIASNYQNAFWD